MNFRYPFNIVSEDLEEATNKVSSFLGAASVSEVGQGIKLDDVFFIGPYDLAKGILAEQDKFNKGSLRLILDANNFSDLKGPDRRILANGVYLASDYTGSLPFFMLYKRVDALDGKPVLISENYLKPGEMAVVPETSEFLAVLFHNDGEKCSIPQDVRWLRWFSDDATFANTIIEKDLIGQPNYKLEYKHSEYQTGRLVEVPTPLFDSEPTNQQLIDQNRPFVQVHPIVFENTARKLLTALTSCDAWVRRTGENNILYTQETFDILEYSEKLGAPNIFRELIAKLRTEKLIAVMSKLTGLQLSSLREVYAFRMRSNEFITKHADSTLNGQLMVRVNWLLQSPAGREYDLRFWSNDDSESAITRFKAIPNSATIFFLGDTTPHDLSQLPENCDKDRYNIVLTFGS